MFQKLTHYLTLVTVVGLAACGSVTASDIPEVMFILDASGSMTEDAGGKAKIDAAKEVMHEIVPALAEEVRVGLTAYGHRRKGDCTDIEVLVPAGSTDRDYLLQHVDALQARGKTPISQAILAVAGMLKTNEHETTIILVSDGIETCGGDPCQVVAQLKKAGLKFVTHVVGFHVDSVARQQLECIAGAGGGTYFHAEDASELLDAMKRVSTEVAVKVEKAKLNPVPIDTGLGKLRISMPAGSQKSLAVLEITRLKDQKVVKRVERIKADSNHPLLSGEYAVAVGFAQPNYGKPTITNIGRVTIRKGETRELKLGSISFNLPRELEHGNRPDKLSVEEVVITDAGTNEPVVTVHNNNHGGYNFKSKPILAGIYDVYFRYWTNNNETPTLVARSVRVSAGSDTSVTLTTGIQFKKTDAGLVGFDLIPRDERIAAANEDGNETTPVEPVLETRAFSPIGGGSSNLWYSYLFAPGSYDIMVHVEGMDEPLPVAEQVDFSEGTFLKFDSGM